MTNAYETDLSEERLIELIKDKELPQHIAIIMDGNGRWAISRNLPRALGHRQGMETLKNVIRTSCEIGIKYITFYAFSTENWKRPAFEINALMALMTEYFERFIDELHENKIKLAVLGDINPLSQSLKEKIENALQLTRSNSGLRLNLALNYGSRGEILRAVKMAITDCLHGKLSPDNLNEEEFKRYLYTCDIPDPDLVIRTGGEYRLSNFLLYQAAYSELFFTGSDIMWPDFSNKDYLRSILEFQYRHRRYGKINAEQEL